MLSRLSNALLARIPLPAAVREFAASTGPPRVPDGYVTGPPEFVGIGVQKAGTSWWYTLLTKHPSVYHHRWPARPSFVQKERNFFRQFAEKPFRPEDTAQYARWFPRPPGFIVGEWTPHYLPMYWAAEQLATAAPKARLLVLLRDPVERYASGVNHDLIRGRRHAPHLHFMQGLYALHLRRWLAAHDRQKLLLLQYERCQSEPAELLAQTQAFLELEPHPPAPSSIQRRVNAAKRRRFELSPQLRGYLRDAYLEDVRQLQKLWPELDLGRWPNFSNHG